MKTEDGVITLVTTDGLNTIYRTMMAVEEYQATVIWMSQPTVEEPLDAEPSLYAPLAEFCLLEHSADLDLFIALHRAGFMNDLARRADGFVGEYSRP